MKQLISICLSLFFCVACPAQYYYYNDQYYDKDLLAEIGISANAMNCITDLGGKAIATQSFKPGIGVYAAVLYRNTIGARFEATWGEVSANDKYAKDAGTRYRNLSFTSAISEVVVLAEFHPLNLKYRPEGMPLLSPYLLLGAGRFSFNPETRLGGHEVLLQPLHTEGEGFPETGIPNYKLSQFCLSAGGGLQYNVSPVLTLRGEAIYRVLNTDYLDDVSGVYIDPVLFDKHLSAADAALARQLYYRTNELQLDNSNPRPGRHRGSTKNDAYYSINIKLGIVLGRTAAHHF